MPILPFAPPAEVTTTGRHGFDYVTVDAVRRRVYAAHSGNSSLLIVDADNGKVLGQVKVGPAAGVAVDPETGNVYTGDGDANALSEVDPVTMKEVHRVSVSGPVDAIAYDPQYHRIYGDEDDGTHLFVIDSRTFKQIGSVVLPGHKPEFLVIDPTTHEVYQNIATNNEIAVVDPKTLTVGRMIPTPDIKNNHPLQFDDGNRQLIVGGENNVLSVYTTYGKRVSSTVIPGRVDQCSLDQQRQILACAANSSIVLYSITKNAAPKRIGELPVGTSMHTLGTDAKTGRIWSVWGSADGDFVQGFIYRQVLDRGHAG
jgi:DNA-binding beta-propeller fold protein YncE